ncbi:hypothetical protein HAX54_011744 [Datura stramonium]|uniref:Uncharacterized protein n=1 Tax=Datura stramonium TaxID=4076 RepID=A0ABS8TKH2_DATST|nr:hypothetical protein [Datura stramonium]
MAQVSHDESVLPRDVPSPSSIPSSEEGVAAEKGTIETSYDYLFEGELPVEKGTSSNILAYGDQLTVQSLTQMAMGDERLPCSERTVPRSSFPAPKSPKNCCYTTNETIKGPDSSSKHQVKFQEIDGGCSKGKSGEITCRRKLKRKVVAEDEVQPENVLDPEGDEGGKETEEELLFRVKRGKTVSQPSSGKGTKLPKRFPAKKIASSSNRRIGDLIDEMFPKGVWTLPNLSQVMCLQVGTLRDLLL